MKRDDIQRIGILGAGRSAGYLIEYLGRFCAETGKQLTVFDLHFERLKAYFLIDDSVSLCVAALDDEQVLHDVIGGLDLVVSVLPPFMHISVAKACLEHGCHLFTASYTSDEMRVLGEAAAEKGLLFMNELGLDPGIDHLSASCLFDQARSERLTITAFESHCGGLVSLEDCGGNPWQYMFTWNPTNVVLAGQGGECLWKENGVEQKLPGLEVFAHAKTIEVPGLGKFDVYPNRNSLTYELLYGLENSQKLLRGTLRREGYCRAWNLLVQLGFTESHTVGEWRTMRDWFVSRTGFGCTADWVLALESKAETIGLGAYMEFLNLENFPLIEGIEAMTSARILERVLLDRWALGAMDKDEVVMVHYLELADAEGNAHQWHSVLQVIGEGGDRTAMAKTVGLPLAMGVETFLKGEAGGVGGLVPFDKSWYTPILHKLEIQGIVFKEYLS
jgi:saccharopine dehydrogenase-like NADP-dependent oxidoreductase